MGSTNMAPKEKDPDWYQCSLALALMKPHFNSRLSKLLNRQSLNDKANFI